MEQLYCGIDLHSNNSVVVLSDEKDKVIYQQFPRWLFGRGEKRPASTGLIDDVRCTNA